MASSDDLPPGVTSRGSEFLPTVPASSAPTPVNPSLPALEALEDDARLVPGEVMGRGGMGEVRAVHDVRLGRELALKTSTAEDASAHARFVREARVQGQLEHPGIVPVHELGLAHGKPFFTMKRVRGITLAEVLRALGEGDEAMKKRFPSHRLLSVVQSLAQTLDFAHARGVVHRDVKPANVMLGDFGEVYLLDWGLAKVEASEPATASAAPAPSPSQPGTTLVGAVMGTPGYMSPEQAAGQSATAACDVWALGVVLYEVLTLEPLLRFDSSSSALAQTQSLGTVSPRAKAPGRDISPELDVLCSLALSHEPARRPSARELAERLEKALSGARDVELRASLARRHAEAARDASARALSSSGDDELAARREALRQVGQALALDPEQRLAQDVFVELLQRAPKERPAEVHEALDAHDHALANRGSWNALLGYGVIAFFLPLALAMGVHDWQALGVMMAAWFATMAVSFAMVRARRLSNGLLFAGILVTSVLSAVQSLVAGPFILTPGMASATAAAMMMWVPRRVRVPGLVFAVLSLLAPLALHYLGLVTPFFRFEGDGFFISSKALHLTEGWTVLLLTLSVVGTLVVSSLSMLNLRGQLDEATARLELQRWSLERVAGR